MYGLIDVLGFSGPDEGLVFRQTFLLKGVCHEEEAVFSGTDCRGAQAGGIEEGSQFAQDVPCSGLRDIEILCGKDKFFSQ